VVGGWVVLLPIRPLLLVLVRGGGKDCSHDFYCLQAYIKPSPPHDLSRILLQVINLFWVFRRSPIPPFPEKKQFPIELKDLKKRKKKEKSHVIFFVRKLERITYYCR
jgi:hypothetical protein